MYVSSIIVQFTIQNNYSVVFVTDKNVLNYVKKDVEVKLKLIQSETSLCSGYQICGTSNHNGFDKSKEIIISRGSY